jgi:hypothetical protein
MILPAKTATVVANLTGTMTKTETDTRTVENTTTSQTTQAGVLATGGGAMQEGSTILVANTNEHWINTHWRPMMGWQYLITCTFDFILFPIGWSALQAIQHGQVTSQWLPLTLQGAGLYHIAMGAVMGITSYGRTKEKINATQ